MSSAASTTSSAGTRFDPTRARKPSYPFSCIRFIASAKGRLSAGSPSAARRATTSPSTSTFDPHAASSGRTTR